MTPLISAPLVGTLNALNPGKKRVVSLTVCASSARLAPAATPSAEICASHSRREVGGVIVALIVMQNAKGKMQNGMQNLVKTSLLPFALQRRCLPAPLRSSFERVCHAEDGG